MSEWCAASGFLRATNATEPALTRRVSFSDTESMCWARLLVFIVPLASAQSLDFETFKTRVEPIFLKKRPGHARCVACHVDAATAFKLQPLAPDAKTWTEEQSRKNFEMVLKLVTPGDPGSSRLLIHPLAHDGGGDQFHGGGRQFASKDDQDWKIIADWVASGKSN
jgi:hypothetical protein